MPEIKKLKENIVYQNKFATVYDDDVLFSSGKKGKYIRFEWNAKGGVAILPVYNDTAYMIKNHRYGEPNPSTEVPQGFIDDHENMNNIEEIARRELLEETGIKNAKFISYGNLGDKFKTYLFVALLKEEPVFDLEKTDSEENISDFVKITRNDVMSGKIFNMNMFGPMSQNLLMRYFLQNQFFHHFHS